MQRHFSLFILLLPSVVMTAVPRRMERIKEVMELFSSSDGEAIAIHPAVELPDPSLGQPYGQLLVAALCGPLCGESCERVSHVSG